MQVISENEDKKRYSGGADSVDFVISARKISRCLEEECIGRFGVRKFGV